MDDLKQIDYFPSFAVGLARATPSHLQRLLTATWHLMLSGRTLIEDAEGAVGSPDYLIMLKLRLSELIVGVDFLLRGVELPDEGHRLAIAAELGITEVAILSPDQLWNAVGLSSNAGTQDEFNCLLEFWNAILEGFPATLPNPLISGRGQRDLVRTLRSWSRLLDQTGLDGKFLAELYKSL